MHSNVLYLTHDELYQVVGEVLLEKLQGASRGSPHATRRQSRSARREEEPSGPAQGGPAAIAIAEFEHWGGRKESDPAMKQALEKYATHLGANKNIFPGLPWSGGFVSWAMQNEPGFNKGAGHMRYMNQAKTARDNGDTTGFVAFKPDEIQPREGDLVCRPREGSGNGWSRIGRKNHCDVFVGGGQMIGGNIDDTSKKAAYNKDRATMIIRKDPGDYSSLVAENSDSIVMYEDELRYIIRESILRSLLDGA